MELLLAHPGHWLISVSYAVPVLVIGGSIAFMALRERRRSTGESDADTQVDDL